MSDLARRLLREERTVIVAIDHPLYSWPCHGLEDRRAVIASSVAAGATGFITSYGTLRDEVETLGSKLKILKLDLTTVSVNSYDFTEYRQAWTVEDATRLGADAVLTYVQLGGPDELSALTAAAEISARADSLGIPYVCEVMPVQSRRFPDPYDPEAIAAATRAGVELGAHVVKTSLPQPAEALASSVAFGVPVLVAGGNPTDVSTYLAGVQTAMEVGAAGVAVGRNAWGAPDVGVMVERIVAAVGTGKLDAEVPVAAGLPT